MTTKSIPTPPQSGGSVYLKYVTSTTAYSWVTIAGGAASDHAGLDTAGLIWSASAHTGDVSTIAGFDGSGLTAYYTVGVDLQAWDTNLDQIAALAVTDGNIMVGDGSAWIAESGDTARLSLGLGSTDDVLFKTLDIVHTAAAADDHAIDIDCNAAGFGDVKALYIDYHSGAIATGQDEAVILVNVDEALATGGDIAALEVLTTEGSASVFGLFAGALVHPIQQLSGVFANMDSFLVKAVDQLAAVVSGGAGGVTLWVADNDTITIGDAAKFEELEFLLDTGASGAGISPIFEFSTGVGTWAAFTPVDGTNAFRNTGVIAWLDGDIPSWAVGTGSEYLIRITRTRNSVTTTPIVDTVQIATVTEYSWDKTGALSVLSVDATTAITAATFAGGTYAAPGSPVHTFEGAVGFAGAKALFYNAGANSGFTSYRYSAAYAALNYTFGLQVTTAQGYFTGTRATVGNSIIELVAITAGANTAMIRMGSGSTTTGAKQYQFCDQGTALNHMLTDYANDSYLCGLGGVIGIGTKTPSTSYVLDVKKSSDSGYVANIENTSTNSAADVLRLEVGITEAVSTNWLIGFYDDGGNIGNIGGNGGGIAVITTSDFDLKKDIEPASGCLAAVKSWGVVEFAWKANGNRQRGFIAQDLHAVHPRAAHDPSTRNAGRFCVTFDQTYEVDVTPETEGDEHPEAVFEERISHRTACHDAAGLAKLRKRFDVSNIQSRPLRRGDRDWANWGVDHAALIPELTGAVQELSDQLNAQALLIATLTARLDALES